MLLIAIGRAMDPYQTLGLPKNCTGDELKEAFRARARLVHPDRGGEPDAFIQLRHAYDQIKNDLGRRPSGASADTNARTVRQDPRPNQPDPNWEPDLILHDLEPTRTRPPGSPDPNWEPELILIDDEPHEGDFSKSPNPKWEPDLILLDDEPLRGRFPERAMHGLHGGIDIGWLARISGRSQHEDMIADESVVENLRRHGAFFRHHSHRLDLLGRVELVKPPRADAP